MMKMLKYLLGVIFLVGVTVAYFSYQTIFGSYVENDFSLTITTNSSYEDVFKQLKDKGIVKNDFLFNSLANKMNYPHKIYAGKYDFEQGISLYDLIVKLRGAHQTPVKLIINNVNFKQDLAAKIASQIEIDSASFYNYITNDSIINSLSYQADNILCLFIPNTYEVYWNISLPELMKKFQKEKEKFWNISRNEKATELGLTTDEVFILASIVEKEYKYADERKRIAGVYLNRLDRGMKLQADPTVKYAVGNLALKRVLTIHTELDNSYNTYYYAGLPPGPICLPETSTIDAVLNAEKHRYLYFCAKADLSGYHTFNSSYTAHLNAARAYQKALNKLKIYE